MRVLAVRQPWASLIVEGLKTIEVRSKPTNIRERVAIYASTSKASRFYFTPNGKISTAYDADFTKGFILGTVEIIDSPSYPIESYEMFRSISNQHLAPDGYYSDKKTYIWRLENPVKFTQPIPYKPPKGAVVWSNFELPEEAK